MNPTDYIDPFHAVDGGGNCLPGPCMPFGMIRPGPDTINHNTNGYATGEDFLHVSHTHVSGTGGAGRYGNIGIVPLIQMPDGRSICFRHENEIARCGYYATTLVPKQGFGEMATDGNVRLEVTAGHRCAIHRWTWGEGTEPWIRIDLGASIAGASLGGFAKWVDPATLLCKAEVKGGWGHDMPWTIYARIEFDRSMQRHFAYGPTLSGRTPGIEWQGRELKVCARSPFRDLGAKIAVSYTSFAQAQRNMEEIRGLDFDALVEKNQAAWGSLLSRATVTGGEEQDHVLWNTLLMRLFTMPGDHGTDEVPWFAARRRHFNDLYCIWDSVRCANSLFSLLDPQFAADLAGCLTEIGEETGWIPDAWIVGGSASIQGGCSAAVLFQEAAVKKLPGFDARAALQVLKKTQETPSPDPRIHGRHAGYSERGYLDTGVKNCTSRTIEYAYHDACAALLARSLGDLEYASLCETRSAMLWESWHERHRCFAPRKPDGSWDDFDPFRPACRDFWNDPHFYEGTAHDYAITVWHDIHRLVERHGGPEPFAAYLDLCRERVWHWKEINLHLPWLYHYAGMPHRGTLALRETMDAKLKPGRGGMADNEDMGAWSSWWICGAMGLFPVPGSDLWLIGAPRFESIEIQAPGTEYPLRIKTAGKRGGNSVVASALWNGQVLERSWLRHQELTGGGELILQMSDRPTGWGVRGIPPFSSR